MVYSPVDLLRVVVSVIALGLVLVMVRYFSKSLAGAERDLIGLADRLPNGVVQLAVRAVQLVAAFVPLAGGIALLVRRQFRRLGGATLAAIAGGFLGRWIMSDLLDLRVGRFALGAGLSGRAPFPSAPYLAAIAAIVAADSPWMSTRWRHASRGWLSVLLALRLFSGTTGIRELIVAIAVGWMVGSVVGAMVGAPDRRPDASSVERALNRLGVSAVDARHVRSASGRHEYTVDTRSGNRLWVEVAARDGWQTMLPGRLYRALRFRDPADGRPFAGLRELSEHEALVALRAEVAGVPTPTIEAIGEVDPGGHLIAFRASEGRSLRSRPELGAEVLPAVWSVLVKMRTARIAHRGLSQDALIVDDGGAVEVVRFAAADLTGDERVLAGDIAEVLAWGSERFGADVTVDTAIVALGPGVVARSLPRLQPLALTRATRSELSSGTLDTIAESVRDRTGIEQPALAPIERIKPMAVLSAVMLLIAINTLIPIFSGFGTVWGQLKTANLAAVAVAAVLSAATYLGAALALSGSVSEPLPFGPNLAVQVAASFAMIAAPAQIGGVALKGRFLQRRGIDSAIAVAAIGLNTVAAFLVHLVILAAFLFWAGSSGLGAVHGPSTTTVGAVAGGIVAIMALAIALPMGRALITDKVIPAVHRAGQGIADVARRPVRLAGLLGGSAIVTMGYVGAMLASVMAFGGSLPVASVALVFLLGSIVQAVAPTPGGLGAAEAAYIGGLTAIGLSADRAVATVLLFRLLTFWIPVLPGWATMTWLQRTKAL